MKSINRAGLKIEFDGKLVRKIAKSPPGSKLLKTEALCLKRLENYRVAPKLIGLGIKERCSYTETEKLPGLPLLDLQPKDLDTQYTVCQSLAQNIGLVHYNDILHRNIKPSNIFLYENKPRIISFGWAVFPGKRSLPRLQQDITTIRISPPEIHLKKSSWTRESDIFSLGVCFYFICSGKFPFDSNDPDELIDLVCFDRLKKLDSPLWPVIKKCLQKDPKKRYSNCEELEYDLKSISKNSSTNYHSTTVSKLKFQKKRLRNTVVFSTVIAVALTVFLVGLLGYSKERQTTIQFLHHTGISKVVMRNEHSTYEIFGDKKIQVEPGYYWVRFTKPDGEFLDTVRYIPKLNQQHQDTSKFAELHRIRVVKGIAQIPGIPDSLQNPFQFPKAYDQNGLEVDLKNQKVTYHYALNICDKSNSRLPTTRELREQGLNEALFLAFDNPGVMKCGFLYPMARSTPPNWH